MKTLLSVSSIKLSVVLLLAGALSACGFHFRGSYLVPEEISRVSLTSYDQYSFLTRSVQSQLRMNDIEMVQPAEDVPNIHLLSGSLGSRTISLYQSMTTAEKELTYTASYRVTIPELGSKQYSTTVNRSYLSNPQTALAKSVEEDTLEEEMIKQASRQIMRQLARLNHEIKQGQISEEEFEHIKIKPEQKEETQEQSN
ncbi:LPS assembly lipoprotein LptE [Vibrio sp. JC009]|uniref:LPS-assembly lipoprotein LptE n=1 Tax=Vibrio sp. JC009 TaxID=2912314 RepID=UPI0023AFB1E7|nr:LPS assembly lipoprotein LptE [Vibrio sp. JC009]WED22494.1 LPS assembly lipoprotein LptE [Vibrio sp. JC009]